MFIVYIDETGDHGLANIDPGSPVFALVAAIYEVEEYLQHDLAELSKVKFHFWKHDNVVFRSHSIRNKIGPFSILADPKIQAEFYDRIAAFFAASRVTLVAAGIHKIYHRTQYVAPANPYRLAVQFVLERIFGHIARHPFSGAKTTLVFESRGRKEDAEVAQWCAELCEPTRNYWGRSLPFATTFANKQTNSIGLQVADLAAYPLSHFVLDQATQRRDWLAIEPRIRRGPTGRMLGWGLKIFP